MDRKITFSAFVIVILFLNNFNLLYAQANEKKETKTHSNDKNNVSSPSQKNDKRGTKGNSGKEKPATTLDLDLYSDYACNNPAISLDWGEIEVGGTQSIILYIKNNGNGDSVAKLVTENWYPEDSQDYMTFNWDYDGHTMSPGEVIAVNLTLEVNAECPLFHDFSFDIVVIST